MTSQFYNRSLIIAFFAFASFSGFAQDERLLADADAVLNSEQITIDGTFSKQVEEKTPEEILDAARRASEIRQIKKIAKKIEKIALPEKQVRKITKKESNRLSTRINTIFNDGEDEQEDKVAVKQAAPVAPAPTPIITPIVIARAEPKMDTEIRPFSKIKVIPYYGIQNIVGEQIDFASKFSGGVAIESMLSRRFSAGIGFSYSTLDITDVADDYESAAYYNNRELVYNHFTVEVNSKFFLSPDTVIKPYIGVGISYNRTSLKFGKMAYVDGPSYSEEKYNSSYMAGHAKIGAEMRLADNVGVNLEFSYSRGLLKGFNYTSYQDTQGQQKLNALGEMIETADFLAVNAGLVVTF